MCIINVLDLYELHTYAIETPNADMPVCGRRDHKRYYSIQLWLKCAGLY